MGIADSNLWNLPDYVEDEGGGEYRCTLCNSTASSVLTICAHLGGNQHAKKCRTVGQPEIVYVKERARLELHSTGHAVVRSGFKKPSKTAASNSTSSCSSAPETAQERSGGSQRVQV